MARNTQKFDVHQEITTRIVDAIETRGLMSVEAIGTALQAGTNCGSCRPEIADLLASLTEREAAE